MNEAYSYFTSPAHCLLPPSRDFFRPENANIFQVIFGYKEVSISSQKLNNEIFHTAKLKIDIINLRIDPNFNTDILESNCLQGMHYFISDTHFN